MPDSHLSSRLITLPSVAREVGVSEATIRRYLSSGKILMDFCTTGTSCIALFRPEKIPAIRDAIFGHPPLNPAPTERI